MIIIIIIWPLVCRQKACHAKWQIKGDDDSEMSNTNSEICTIMSSVWHIINNTCVTPELQTHSNREVAAQLLSRRG